MTTLHAYLIRQNLFIVLASLVTCLGIYLLVDVFDRMDKFMEKGASLETTCVYFAVKIPLIISQILPAVFFLALLVQLNILHKERETVALEAGGIAPARLIVFFLCYALLWGGLQLFFSQFLGVQGERKSEAIWDTLGEQKAPRSKKVTDIWFREARSLVHIGSVWPEEGRGKDIAIYTLNKGFSQVDRVIKAQTFRLEDEVWVLHKVRQSKPQALISSTKDSHVVRFEQNLADFATVQDDDNPEKMSLWTLGTMIERLRDSGTNVQTLVTAWHMKLSYASSIVVLSLLSFCLASRNRSLFFSLSLGLMVLFGFYSLHVMGGALGERGALSPWAGAWFGNGLGLFLGLGWLWLRHAPWKPWFRPAPD